MAVVVRTLPAVAGPRTWFDSIRLIVLLSGIYVRGRRVLLVLLARL